VIRRLDRARERNNRQLAELRDREQRVERALRDYFAATEKAESVEQSYVHKIERLRTQIDDLRAESAARVDQVRDGQARALFVLHDAGRTVKQVAELVDVPEKVARHLIGVGRRLSDPSHRREYRPGGRAEGRRDVESAGQDVEPGVEVDEAADGAVQSFGQERPFSLGGHGQSSHAMPGGRS
jgi:hypothetical protein